MSKSTQAKAIQSLKEMGDLKNNPVASALLSALTSNPNASGLVLRAGPKTSEGQKWTLVGVQK